MARMARNDALTFETTAWQRSLYDARRYNGGLLRGAEGDLALVLGDHYVERVGDITDDDMAQMLVATAGAHAQCFAREVYARLYDGPQRLPGARERWAHLAHEVLDGVPEFAGLCSTVQGDPDMSALAAAALLETVANELPPLLEQLEQEQQGQPDAGDGGDLEEPQGAGGGGEGDDGDSEPGSDSDGSQQGSGDGGEGDPEPGSDEPGEGGEPGGEPGGDQGSSEVPEQGGASEGESDAMDRLRMALRQAARESQGEVGESQAGLSALAPGMGTAPPAKEQRDDTRMRLVEMLREREDFSRVLRIAGRIVRINERIRRSLDPHGSTVPVDIEMGGDISKLLVSELAALGSDDELEELLALARLADNSMLQYRTTSEEEMGRGPFTVLVDLSGSMLGWSGQLPGEHNGKHGVHGAIRPVDYAIAVGVAAVGIAARQHREAIVARFDYVVNGAFRFRANGRVEWKRNSYADRWEPYNGTTADAVLDMIRWTSWGGMGTSFDTALSWAQREIVEHSEEMDLLFVTDGQDTVRRCVVQGLEAMKEKGLRLFGLTLNGGALSSAIEQVCDVVVDLDREDDPARVVGNLAIGRK